MDKVIVLTKEEVKKLPRLKVNSTEAILKIYNHNELLKIYIDPEYEDIKKLEYLIYEYSGKLKTKMPLAPVYIDDNFYGSAIYYFKGAKHISYLRKIKDVELKINKLKTLKNKLIELTSNNLYTVDLHSGNVLLTKENLDVEIIDVDRRGLEITDFFNKNLYNNVVTQYMRLILEVFFGEYHPTKSVIFNNTTYILEKHKIKPDYIEKIANEDTSFEFTNEFLDYLKVEKKQRKILEIRF